MRRVSELLFTPSEPLRDALGFPNVSNFQEEIAKDFFEKSGSDLQVYIREPLSKKKVIQKRGLVSGEYELCITCISGKFFFSYSIFNEKDEVVESRQRVIQKKKHDEEKYTIIVENEGGRFEALIKEKGMFSRSSYEFLFRCVKVKNELVKEGMWQISQDVKLGEGGFAEVFLGMNEVTGKLMAVKRCSIGERGQNPQIIKQKVDQLEKEIDTMKELKHPNIVRYLGMERQENCVYIFMDFISGGSIEGILTQFAFTELLIQQHAKKVLRGLLYLHEREILHRDIKAANVLYDEDGNVYLSDFGASKKYTMELLANQENEKEDKGLYGTPQFMAPEVWKERKYSPASDVWSFGCFLIEMITSEEPWEEEMEKFENNPIGFINYMARNIDHKEIVNIDALCVSIELKDLLKKCLSKVPEKRPSVEVLLEHRWFQTKLAPTTPIQASPAKATSLPLNATSSSSLSSSGSSYSSSESSSSSSSSCSSSESSSKSLGMKPSTTTVTTTTTRTTTPTPMPNTAISKKKENEKPLSSREELRLLRKKNSTPINEKIDSGERWKKISKAEVKEKIQDWKNRNNNRKY